MARRRRTGQLGSTPRVHAKGMRRSLYDLDFHVRTTKLAAQQDDCVSAIDAYGYVREIIGAARAHMDSIGRHTRGLRFNLVLRKGIEARKAAEAACSVEAHTRRVLNR